MLLSMGTPDEGYNPDWAVAIEREGEERRSLRAASWAWHQP